MHSCQHALVDSAHSQESMHACFDQPAYSSLQTARRPSSSCALTKEEDKPFLICLVCRIRRYNHRLSLYCFVRLSHCFFFLFLFPPSLTVQPQAVNENTAQIGSPARLPASVRQKAFPSPTMTRSEHITITNKGCEGKGKYKRAQTRRLIKGQCRC